MICYRAGISRKWQVDSVKYRGGVQSLYCYDMTGDGIMDLLVGRSDGTLQIFSLPDDQSYDITQPTERFSYVIILSTQINRAPRSQID